MAINKVIFAGKTLIDISDSTVRPETLAEGVVAYNAKGERIVGTMKAGGASSTVNVLNDENGNLRLSGLTASYEDGNVTTGNVVITDDDGNIRIGG